jgi:hypothetical protein
MTIADIAKDFVALCQAGDLDGAGEKYWAENVISVEAMGPSPESQGKAAAKAKGEWWYGAHDVHNVETHGPYVNGDQFAVRFVMDVTVKETGVRMTMDEVGVYTIKDGMISEERFFYS